MFNNESCGPVSQVSNLLSYATLHAIHPPSTIRHFRCHVLLTSGPRVNLEPMNATKYYHPFLYVIQNHVEGSHSKTLIRDHVPYSHYRLLYS